MVQNYDGIEDGKKTVKRIKMLKKPLINIIGILMSDIGSNQLTSVQSRIIRKPINPSRKEKKSMHFGHDHETKLGDYPNKSLLKNLSN